MTPHLSARLAVAAGVLASGMALVLDGRRVRELSGERAADHGEGQGDAFSKYRIQFVGRGGRVRQEVSEPTAVYEIKGDEGYVRARVIESNGRMAWCQPVRVG